MKLTNEQLAQLLKLAKDGRVQLKFDVLHIPEWAEGPGAEFSIAKELVRLAQPPPTKIKRRAPKAIARPLSSGDGEHGCLDQEND